MKTESILYLVPDTLVSAGGIARYCRMVSKALVEDGRQLTIVSLMDDKRAAIGIPEQNYVICHGKRLVFLLRTLQIVLRSQPSLIMVGHVNLGTLGWILSQIGRIRLLTFIYGIDAWIPLKRLRHKSLTDSDRIISISKFSAQKAKQINGISLDKTKILHNCLDPSFELLSPQAQITKKCAILTVARISLAEQYKGHDVVLRAMPALLKIFPDLIYDIVGDGDGREILEELASELGLTDQVRFHGYVPEQDLSRFYAESQLFIMPSRGEGFGFVFLEAMAYGLPVIAGNIDASPEVVVDGQTGILVNPTSVDEIIKAASRILGDDDLRDALGQAGKNRVTEEFSYPTFRKGLLDLIETQD